MRSLRLLSALALLGVATLARPQAVAVVRRPSPMDVMLRDGLAGGIVGSAVAGGILASNLALQGRTGLDWGRTLAWGAGLGVGAGLVLGMIDVATTRRAGSREHPVRDGLSRSLDARGRDQSRSHLFPVLSRIF